MIRIENLTKSYGARVLLENVGFKLNRRERVGVVGRNGHGKTTLFRLITGEEHPDSGQIVIPRGYRIGHVEQQIRFTRETVLEEVMTSLPATEKGHHWEAEKLLVGLGFSNDDMGRPPTMFSGGFQVRLNLAKALAAKPDLLLLDEPTNYLDITSIRWISRFLNAWPSEIMLITHDRGFMDRIVTHVLGIHRQKIRKIEGDTEKYYAQIAQDEEIYEKTRQNDERRRKEVELFISRFRAKARLANMVQSRMKTLAKMEKKDKLQELESLEFSFRSEPFPGKFVMRVEGLCFGYAADKPPIIDHVEFGVNAGDRICIVGPNGKGKTTLLKLLAGILKPDAGTIHSSPRVVTGFYEQTNVQSLDDRRTVLDEIHFAHGDVDLQKARNFSGAMMFSGDDALKKVKVLSGGEKCRVMLGKILATPVNLLLLDEPTNHLDMDSGDALLEAIDAFDGTVVMVTHSEMFLHAIAGRLIVFKDSGIEVFEGTYQDFLDRGGWSDDDAGTREEPPEEEAPPAAVEPKRDRKTRKRLRSEVINARSRALTPLQRRVRKTEETIESRETEMAYLNDAMIDASQQQDGTRIAELAALIRNCRNAIDEAYGHLEDLAGELEEKQAEFDNRLEELEG